jgi:hypothetical protein
MSDAETWTIIIAAVALVVSIAALIVSIVAVRRLSRENREANTLRSEHLKLQHTMAEVALRNQIVEARRELAEFFSEHQDFLRRMKDAPNLSAEDKGRRAALVAASDELIERSLNALDAACQSYLDDKIDKIRFKKAYQRDIRQAVQNEVHRQSFQPGHAYNALMRVYEEWENPEKP